MSSYKDYIFSQPVTTLKGWLNSTFKSIKLEK